MPDNKNTFLPVLGYPHIKALLIILNALELFKLLTNKTQFTYSNFMDFFSGHVHSQSTESNTHHALDAPRPNQEHQSPIECWRPNLDAIASEISDFRIEACREYLHTPKRNEPNQAAKDFKVICRKFKKDADIVSLLKKLFKLHEDCNSAGEDASSALQEALQKHTFIHVDFTDRGAATVANSGEYEPNPKNSAEDNDPSATENHFNEIVDDKFREELAERVKKIFSDKYGINLDIDFNTDFKNKYEIEFNHELKSAFVDIFRKHFKEKEQAKAQAAAETTTTTTAAPSDNGEQLSVRAAVTQNETLATSAVPVADGDTEPTSHTMPLPIASGGIGGQQGALSDDVPSTQALLKEQAEATKPTDAMSAVKLNANPPTKPVFKPLYRPRPDFEQEEEEEQQLTEALRQAVARIQRTSKAYWEHPQTADHDLTCLDWAWDSEKQKAKSEQQKNYWRTEKELAEFFGTQANAEAEVETTTTTTTAEALSGSSEQDTPPVNPMDEAGPQENPQPTSASSVPAVNPPSLEQVPANIAATDADAVQTNALADQEPDDTTDGLQRAPSDGDVDLSMTATPPIAPSTNSASTEWNATLMSGAPPGTDSDPEPISHTVPLPIAGADAGQQARLDDYTPDPLLADIVASISGYDASL